MTRSRWCFAFGVAAALVFGSAGAAAATPPVDLGSSRVSDPVGILTPAEEAAVDAHLVSVSKAAGVDLWVVYVDTFTDPSDAADWANGAAEANGLGPDQYLLAVATEGRQYYLSGDVQYGPVSDQKLGDIESNLIQPRLSAGDWAGAATAAADGLARAVGKTPPGSGGTDGSSSSGVPVGGIVAVAVGAGAAGLVVWMVVRSRRRRTASGSGSTAPGEIPLAQLEREAASMLVATDDAVKTSEQELGFAAAQFGDEATADFARVIAEAKAGLDEAFHLKQQLDDDEPDTPEQTRTWTEQIIALCTRADESLDAKAAEFDELRKLEQNAPEALARVQEQRLAAHGTADAAAARLNELRAVYAAEELSGVEDNPEHAAARLSFADERLAAAQTAIGAGDGSAAAVGIRGAEQAIAQAVQLGDAVETRARDLAHADADIAALVADLEGDFVAAAALPDPDGRLAGVIAAARQTVDATKAHLTGPARRPTVTLEQLNRANNDVDTFMANVRNAQEQNRRAAQQLTQQLSAAQGQVSAAEDFITSRRGAVGAAARTRLAEAGSTLVHARQLAESDPVQALQLAQRAHELARQAMQHAQQDVGGFAQNSGGGFSDALLGGILINSMLGGGSSRSRSGGWSGSSSRSGGWSSGSGRSRSGSSSRGGGFSAGSFGGSGTRSRRGGGRF